MKRIRLLKLGVFVMGFLLLSGSFLGCSNNSKSNPYLPKNNQFSHPAQYIDIKKSLLSEGFEVCDTNYIIQYYNPERATYSKGKNGLRKFILSNYKNEGYSDSGYLNFRFIINCKGEAGCYVIHENDLDLMPKIFNKDLKQQLFELTAQLKKWNPNFTHDANRDSYMYISYRIENGEITEIIP